MRKYVLYGIICAGALLGFGCFLQDEVLAAGSNGNSTYEDNFGDYDDSETQELNQKDDKNEKGEESDKNESKTAGCDGIKLNTDFPLIGNCIKIKKGEGTDVTQAFPTMIGALTKIIISIILVVCFIMIIVAGIMRASDNPAKAKGLIMKVAITILLLGFSGVILKLINPNFFS